MAAHKFWSAVGMQTPTNGLLELSEFQLYSGATRLDASATLTADTAPTSGTLASLKDNVTTTGAVFNDAVNVVLSWAFPTAVEVDGVLLGARTLVNQFPNCGLLVGSDTVGRTGLCTVRGFGGMKFVSATKTPVVALSNPKIAPRNVFTQKDYGSEGGRGLITSTVKTHGSPDFPTFAKVRLLRDIDDKVIRETWSDKVTGVYKFDWFDEHFTYTVKAVDPSGAYRAVVADGQIPEIMP